MAGSAACMTSSSVASTPVTPEKAWIDAPASVSFLAGSSTVAPVGNPQRHPSQSKLGNAENLEICYETTPQIAKNSNRTGLSGCRGLVEMPPMSI